MTTMELNTFKMELLREIVNGFNSESSLSKLATACRIIKSEEKATLPAMPADILTQLMEEVAKEDAEGMCLSSQELEQEMALW